MSVRLLVLLLKMRLFCALLGNQGICATGFKHAQGNEHCAKKMLFKSTTNKSTFEHALINMITDIQHH